MNFFTVAGCSAVCVCGSARKNENVDAYLDQ